MFLGRTPASTIRIGSCCRQDFAFDRERNDEHQLLPVEHRNGALALVPIAIDIANIAGQQFICLAPDLVSRGIEGDERIHAEIDRRIPKFSEREYARAGRKIHLEGN